MRLRDLLHRRRTTTLMPEPATVAALLYPRPDSWRSPLCQPGRSEVDHRRCGHPANRLRHDGCSCPCHTPTSYDTPEHAR